MQHKFPVLIFIFMIANFVYSQNILHFSVGQPMHFPDARSLSMGGAGSVSLATPGAILYNPAALTQIDRTLVMDISLFSRKFEERRSYPLYDRFGSFLVNSTYAINNNWYHNPQGAVAYRLPINFLPNSTIAIGTYTDVDQNYTYLEEVRENIFGDEIIAYNRLEINGKLQRYAIAFAFSVPKIQGLSIGVQTSSLRGSLGYKKNVNYVETGERVVIYDLDGKLDNSPQIFSIGVIYNGTKRYSVGFDLVFPYQVAYDWSDLKTKFEYPLKLNAGFEYRARQDLKARLNIDVGYEFWSKSEFKYSILSIWDVPINYDYSDVFYFKVGIEHIFFNKIPFGVGAQYRNSYLLRGLTQTLLSAGTGFFGNNWRVDVAGAFSKLSYRWLDLFPDDWYVTDPNFQPRIDLDTVDEYSFLGMISLKYFLDF